MFLTENDYIVASEKSINVLQQSDPARREKAEAMAIEEMCGYLRERYDTALIFQTTDQKRNDLIVMYACDIALYHLASWLPGKMGFEIREKRYDQAIKWLQGVQTGKIMPGLPTYTKDGLDDINNPIRYGSGNKNQYEW